MRQATVDVYLYDDLSDSAKEKAREWYRRASEDDTWWDNTFCDFIEVAKCLGFHIGDREYTYVKPGGGTGYGTEPKIYFRGFWSQGDGASFEGDFILDDALNAFEKIKEYAPQDRGLQLIALRLQTAVHQFFAKIPVLKGNRSSIKISQRDSHYVHENTMYVDQDIESDLNSAGDTADLDWRMVGDEISAIEETALDAARRLAKWLYRALEKEHDYYYSDESVAEAIVANEYEFTVDGRRFTL